LSSCYASHTNYLTGSGDLLFGSSNSQIATLVERQTRYLMLVKLAAKDTETVVDALIKNTRKLPQELYKSLTWDRGKEMADHKRFTLATDIQVYFCDPRSPWQRGSNENTNGCSGSTCPRASTSLVLTGQAECGSETIERATKKDSGYQTPAEMFSQTVALTS
jgi:IS30 family transposase